MKRQMPKVTKGVKALFVLPLITFYFTQSHGLKSVYLKCGRLSIRSIYRSEEYLVWKDWRSNIFRKDIFFYSGNIVTLDFATKTFNMRYEGNLSKDYNLLKSHFM